GDGGGGNSLAILVPAGKGLAKDQDYLPTLVQGELVSNFSAYSTLGVLDRMQLDAQYSEIYSGYYDDAAKGVYDLGHLPPTTYIMGGAITRTASGYALQLQITRTADKMTAASYSGTCTFAELDNLTGIKRASLELLIQMGVPLSDAQKAELASAASRNNVEAQIALAQGIMATQKSRGQTTFESLQYMYQAQALDPALAEAAGRLASFETTALTVPELALPVLEAASTGNIGEDARNDVARYRAERAGIIEQQEFYLSQRTTLLDQQKILLAKQAGLIKLLAEADDFYEKHPPFDIYYDPGLEQVGTTDVRRETVSMRFRVQSVPRGGSFDAIQSILLGLEQLRIGFRDINNALDKTQEELGKVNTLGAEKYAVKPVAGVQAEDKTGGNTWALPKWTGGKGRRFAISAVLRNENGKTIGSTKATLFNPLIENHVFSPDIATAAPVFADVNVNDITDTLTIVITNVNGMSAEAAGRNGYISIAASTALDTFHSPYAAQSGPGDDLLDDDGFDRAGIHQATGTPYGPDGYNIKGKDKDGYGRDGLNWYGLTREENKWGFQIEPVLLGWGNFYETGSMMGQRIELCGIYLSTSSDSAIVLVPLVAPIVGPVSVQGGVGGERVAIVAGISINVLPRMLFMSIGGGARLLYEEYYNENSHSKYTRSKDTQGILELGLKFYPLPWLWSYSRWLYVLGTYRLVGFEEHAFTVGAGFAWRFKSWNDVAADW
ncbi:MAG: hypothetical protein LBR23_10150, partial [Spirochaetaceae bacterium]|nr:hypothetical protein [Spirochaetaceae bacterium]